MTRPPQRDDAHPTAREQEILADLQSGNLDEARERTLLKELGRVGGASSVPALRERIRSYDKGIAGRSVVALGRIGNDDAIDALTECLFVSDGVPLGLAASELNKAGSIRAVPEILHCLQTRHDEISPSRRRLLIQALNKTPHVSQIPVLSAALREPGYWMRHVAAVGLQRIRAPESTAALESGARELSWWSGLPARRALRRKRARGE
jgi:HEAT repeat protein